MRGGRELACSTGPLGVKGKRPGDESDLSLAS